MTLFIPETAPGMNILLRMHFRERGKLRDKWQMMLRAAAGTRRITDPCSIRITRFYCSNAMDIDGLYSSAKLPLDGLVRAKILVDDNPRMVVSLKMEQIKVKTRKEEGTEINLTEV